MFFSFLFFLVFVFSFLLFLSYSLFPTFSLLSFLFHPCYSFDRSFLSFLFTSSSPIFCFRIQSYNPRLFGRRCAVTVDDLDEILAGQQRLAVSGDGLVLVLFFLT